MFRRSIGVAPMAFSQGIPGRFSISRFIQPSGVGSAEQAHDSFVIEKIRSCHLRMIRCSDE